MVVRLGDPGFLSQDFLSLRDHFCRVVGHLVDMSGPNPIQEGLRPESASWRKTFWGIRSFLPTR